jgi:hypothetical protein
MKPLTGLLNGKYNEPLDGLLYNEPLDGLLYNEPLDGLLLNETTDWPAIK